MRTSVDKITEADFELFKKHRRLINYTPQDISELDRIVRTYINEHHKNCSGCGHGTLRLAKDLCNIFLANNEVRILEIFAEKEKDNESLANGIEPIKKFTGKKIYSNEEAEQNIIKLINQNKGPQSE